MLTLIAPVASNEKFWNNVDHIARQFEQGNADEIAAFPKRWEATRENLDKWRKAWLQNG